LPTNNRFLFLIAVFTIFAPAICSAAQKITFQLDWLPGGDKAPIYVGLQRGFFAAEGVLGNDSDPDGDALSVSLVSGLC